MFFEVGSCRKLETHTYDCHMLGSEHTGGQSEEGASSGSSTQTPGGRSGKRRSSMCSRPLVSPNRRFDLLRFELRDHQITTLLNLRGDPT